MGGRGSSSGFGKEEGFSYTSGGKTLKIQKTTTGMVLVNGQPKNVSYEKLKAKAKTQSGYTELSGKELAKARNDRYKDYNSHDYELVDNTRGKKKLVYR